MSYPSETSDARILGLLADGGPQGITALAELTGVTATAVRQRLSRLMRQGLVARELSRHGRGRPSHRYQLTEQARRQTAGGNNFADLAMALWQEVRAIRDPEVRRGLFLRLADSLARGYGEQVNGQSLESRLEQIRKLFAERKVPIEIEPRQTGPKLIVVDCPYPELAQRDRSICAMEKLLLSQLLEAPMRLSSCRLDGHACCQFETGAGADIVATLP